mmetsp:Transcript_33217/g.50097  ORF Transcript_33217/g.50097 Transcript_33217/m.50097 type:complete len:201 (-) Transcript_33217:453-1055(-)
MRAPEAVSIVSVQSGFDRFFKSQILISREDVFEAPDVKNLVESPKNASFSLFLPSCAGSMVRDIEAERASQIRTFLSLQLEANVSPLKSQTMSCVKSGTSIDVMASPFSTSQVFTVQSALVDSKILLAVGWYRSRVTFFLCPTKSVNDSVRFSPALNNPFSSVGSHSSGMPHTLIVVSSLALANIVSSNGLKSKSRTDPL